MKSANIERKSKQTNCFIQKFQCHFRRVFHSIRHSANGSALIIFDVMGFVHNFGTTIELSLGGRQSIYMRDFEEFLIKLRTAGATLAFFCDGQLLPDKNDEWCRRRDAEFIASLAMIDEHKQWRQERQERQGSKYERRFGNKTIVKSLLKLVKDKRYGKVEISTEVDCDAAISSYALSNKALAVVASDSDFLIFGGDFQWWESNSINMKQMTAMCFERNKLRQVLSLTQEQMKYFATMAGNDHTKHITRKRCDLMKIAQLCRTISMEQSEEAICQQIANYMLIEQHIQIDVNLIARSINSYNIHFEAGEKSTEYSSNVLMFAFSNQQVFQYEVNFLDFKQRNNNNNNRNNNNNNNHSFVFTLLDVFRKLGGILLKDTPHQNSQLKIVTKYGKNEGYKLKMHTPIYPEGETNIHIRINQLNLKSYFMQFKMTSF